jgi:hypothetical protein
MTQMSSPAIKAKQREAISEVNRMRFELELLLKQLTDAHNKHYLKTPSFVRARDHLDSVWRACSYAIQALEEQ